MLRLLNVALALACLATFSLGEDLRFKVSLEPSLKADGASGRLLIFMTSGTAADGMIKPDYSNPELVYVTGVEVAHLGDKEIEVNPDLLASPRAFSSAPSGTYKVMALLDLDHSYSYDGVGEGDLVSGLSDITLPTRQSRIVLSRRIPATPFTPSKNLRVVEFASKLLTQFWGRPIKMQASVLLPPSYGSSKKDYAASYTVHGFTGSHLKASDAPIRYQEMEDGSRPEMVNIYLNARCALGHHAFVDSVNNGPWASALVQEFIPYLEREFRLQRRSSSRLLTGHSSGAWSVLWLQVNHPDFFGGAWASSPDPVDFRNNTGPDFTLTPPQNAFVDSTGHDHNLVRFGNTKLMSLRQYALLEAVLGESGGQIASANAVFSPRGPDGRPMRLFDSMTGTINPLVQEAWQKFDISQILRSNWAPRARGLAGKLNIFVGTADTFHLDASVRLLDSELKKLGSDAKFEYLEGKGHFDLYTGDLSLRIAHEMYFVASRRT